VAEAIRTGNGRFCFQRRRSGSDAITFRDGEQQMTPNWEQFKSALRTLLAFGGGIALDHGWITAGQLQTLLDPQLLAAIGTLGGLAIAVWGMYTHSKTNAVAVVAAMPEVARVQTANTPEGRTLAADVGSTPAAVVTVAPK
jgi:hypothetical protein